MLQAWGFQCLCDLCTAPPEVSAESDKRRQDIVALKQEAMSLAQQGDLAGAVNVIDDQINLMAEEGLESLLREQYEVLARIHWALGDKGKAKEFGAKAVDLLTFQGYLDPRHAEWHVQILLRNFDRM